MEIWSLSLGPTWGSTLPRLSSGFLALYGLPPLMRTAPISAIVFMSGLAAGVLLVILLDGWPSPMLIADAGAELVPATWNVV